MKGIILSLQASRSLQVTSWETDSGTPFHSLNPVTESPLNLGKTIEGYCKTLSESVAATKTCIPSLMMVYCINLHKAGVKNVLQEPSRRAKSKVKAAQNTKDAFVNTTAPAALSSVHAVFWTVKRRDD